MKKKKENITHFRHDWVQFTARVDVKLRKRKLDAINFQFDVSRRLADIGFDSFKFVLVDSKFSGMRILEKLSYKSKGQTWQSKSSIYEGHFSQRVARR
jgi:hypothetical protein